MVTARQVRLLLILFSEAGIRDRDQRLAVTSRLVGRQVHSSNDLTIAEASALIDELKAAVDHRDRETR